MSHNDLNVQPHDRRGRDKARSQAFWGAAANLPAVDAILESCRALDEDGEPINRESVRARSGVTFTNQLAAGIALYKRRRSLLANHPATPAMIIELITQAVEKQFESVGEKADQRLQKIQEAFTEALNASNDENEHLQTELTAKDQDIAELRERLESAESTIDQQKNELKVSVETQRKTDGDYKEALASQHRLRRVLTSRRRRVAHQLKQSRTTLTSMKQEFEDQSERLTRQHDKVLENLHVQLDNQRTDFRKQEKQLREDIAIAKNERENAINEKYELKQALAQKDQIEERLTLDKKRLEKQLEDAGHELAYARRQLEQIDNINDTLNAMKNMVKPLPGK